MIIEKPGLYKNISNEDYHASLGISNTGLKVLLDCPKRYWYEYLSLSGKVIKKEKKEYTIGTAVHTHVLEPDTFYSRYYVTEKFDRRTTKGKEGYAKAQMDAAGKIVLEIEDYYDVLGMAESVRSHPKFKRILQGGEIENSIMWQDPDSGALLRTRPDYYNDFLITDLKTTKGAAKNFFAKSIVEYGYHRQAAMACDGLSTATGREYNTVILFVVEEAPPYLCVAYLIKDRAIELGRTEYKRGALLYQECLTSNYWPGYGDEIMEIDLPNWYYSMGEKYD